MPRGGYARTREIRVKVDDDVWMLYLRAKALAQLVSQDELREGNEWMRVILSHAITCMERKVQSRDYG